MRQDEGSDFAPDMPPVTGFERLLNLLWEIGPTMSGAMGAGPLTHGEIESAQRNLGIRLTPWECRILRRLSIEYLNESHAATKPDRPAPWIPEVAEGLVKAGPTELQLSLRRLAKQ